MSPTPSQKQRMVGAGFPEMGEGPPPGWVTGAAWCAKNVSRSLLVMGPRVGGSLGTKASDDSFSCVANTRGPSLGFINGGRVCLQLSEQVISQDPHIHHH